jgi:hypothetical protein
MENPLYMENPWKVLSQSQNPVSFRIGSGKNGQEPAFSLKFREAGQAKLVFPKAKVLGKPHPI